MFFSTVGVNDPHEPIPSLCCFLFPIFPQGRDASIRIRLMEWSDMNDLRRATFIPFIPHPILVNENGHVVRHVTQTRQPVKRRSFDAPAPPPEPLLLSLCRQEKWDQVLSRCETHPHEAVPIALKKSGEDTAGHAWKRDRIIALDKDDAPGDPYLYEQTALGIVCSSAVSSDVKLNLMHALLKASPEQLITPQKVKGCSPLRDLIHSPICQVAHLRALLEIDQDFFAVSMYDTSGLTPIDHLIMRLHLNPCELNIKLFHCYVDIVENQSRTTSPIIRLLSLSRSPGFGTWKETTTVTAIIECTKHVLQKNPSRINDVSKSSGCSVLHVALRNFGDQHSLIQLLLEAKESRDMLSRRNVFGDLPLHVACAGGSPMTILKLILTKSLEAVPLPEEGPHPLLWSTNYSGYTAVDLEWMRHIEGGGGLYERRTFYPLEERGLRCQSPRQEGMYRNLLHKAVHQVMNGSRDTTFFGALLDRIILVVQMAHSATAIAGGEYILHAASSLTGDSGGPTLPIPLLILFHWMHKEKTQTRDAKGRLPLHYALMNHGGSDSSNKIDLKSIKDIFWIDMLLESFPEGPRIYDKSCRLPLHYALGLVSSSCRLDVVSKLLAHNPESIERRDPITGLYPFQQAAISDLDSCFYLLRQAPHLVAPSLHN